MRNINTCPIAKRVFKVDIPCSYPDKAKCGKFKYKWLCKYRVKDLGIDTAKKELLTLLRIAVEDKYNNPAEKPRGVNVKVFLGRFPKG